MYNDLIYLKTAFELILPFEKQKTKQNKKKNNDNASNLHSGLILWGLHHFDPYSLFPRSSVKWSDPGHFPKAQGKFIFSFSYTLFYIFLAPKNYKLSL